MRRKLSFFQRDQVKRLKEEEEEAEVGRQNGVVYSNGDVSTASDVGSIADKIIKRAELLGRL